MRAQLEQHAAAGAASLHITSVGLHREGDQGVEGRRAAGQQNTYLYLLILVNVNVICTAS